MNAVLFSKTGLFAGTSFKIEHEATIGKNDGNTVVLRSDIISSYHAKISYDETQNAYFLEDLGSSNGTKLDGIRVKRKEKLERLHVITFAGKFDFIFQLGGVMPAKVETPNSAPAPVIEKTMMDNASQKLPLAFGQQESVQKDKTMFESGKDGGYTLPSFDKPQDKLKDETISSPASQTVLPQFKKQPELKSTDDEVRTEAMQQLATPAPAPRPKFILVAMELNKDFELKDGATSIGRTIGCDIIIDDASLSRKHAVITVAGDKITIRDLGSSNGTSVDKKRISNQVEITPASVIKLGLVEVRIKKEN